MPIVQLPCARPGFARRRHVEPKLSPGSQEHKLRVLGDAERQMGPRPALPVDDQTLIRHEGQRCVPAVAGTKPRFQEHPAAVVQDPASMNQAPSALRAR